MVEGVSVTGILNVRPKGFDNEPSKSANTRFSYERRSHFNRYEALASVYPIL